MLGRCRESGRVPSRDREAGVEVRVLRFHPEEVIVIHRGTTSHQKGSYTGHTGSETRWMGAVISQSSATNQKKWVVGDGG